MEDVIRVIMKSAHNVYVWMSTIPKM